MPFTLDFGQSFNHYALEHLIHSCTCKFCNTWKDVNILKQNCWAYKYSILLCIRPTISFKQSHLQKENLHIILRTFKITFCHFHRISIKHSNNIYQKIALKWCVLNTGKYGWIHYLLMFNSGESFFFFLLCDHLPCGLSHRVSTAFGYFYNLQHLKKCKLIQNLLYTSKIYYRNTQEPILSTRWKKQVFIG